MSEADPIQRIQLHDEVVRKLRGMILRGEMAPGARVQERALCEQFQISRTPLREALKVLASSGLIELWPNRGARVTPLRLDDAVETFEVLSVLERRAGELAARLLNEADLQRIRRLHETMLGFARTGQSERLLEVDLEIHRSLVEATGNRIMASVHAGLAIRVERVRFLVTTSPERMRSSMEEHEVILRAVLARDPLAVADALYAHCLKTRDAVVAAIEARTQPEAEACAA